MATSPSGISASQLEEALRPLWHYASANGLAEGATSLYQEEPGIAHDVAESVLRLCWTVMAIKTFSAVMEDLTAAASDSPPGSAAIRVSFYTTPDCSEEEAHERRGSAGRFS